MKSVTVRVIGGLGNQMHCYAFGRALAAKNGTLLKLDAESGYWKDPFGRAFLLDQFPGLAASHISTTQLKSEWSYLFFRLLIKLKLFCSVFLPLRMKLIVKESSPLCYKETILNTKYVASPYFMGYWATHHYCSGIANELRQELKPKEPTHPSAQSLLYQIRSVKSCFIHWRSYREDKNFDYPDLRWYYSEAVRLVSEKYPDIVFFVFSDDPVEARKQIVSSCRRMIYVDLEVAQGDLQSLVDFYLMYACDHAIIGNSSFSWWAAWLGEPSGRTVVAPGGVSPWGDDWTPPQWFVLDINDCRE